MADSGGRRVTTEAIVLQAFIEIRQGRSPEQVLCDDDLNQTFLATCRKVNASLSEENCNTTLLNLRKANKLAGLSTKVRKKRWPGGDRYSTCVGQAARLMERQFDVNVDRILCNPERRCQFDALVQFMEPGAPAFECRFRALTLRKTRNLRPEPVGQILRATQSRIIRVDDLESMSAEIPEAPGVYIFFAENKTLYVGKADNLRNRINDHVKTWSFREMIAARQDRGPAWLTFHALPLEISSRELRAYETELIKSRHPEHNRAGKQAKEYTK